MALSTALAAHLESGTTTLCRCWAVVRKDGETFGFTDHDLPLSFDGIAFKPESGMAAAAIQGGTGLAVDNTEAIGVLSDDSLSEAEIRAGRFDGAAVTAWLVNWRDVAQRVVLFKGTLGEVKRGRGAFTAELRSQAEALNQPQGRVFQMPCSAVLGDAECGFDTLQPGFYADVAVEAVTDQKRFVFTSALGGFDDRWFERGRCEVLDGAAEGLVAWVKNDRLIGGTRTVELWEALRADVAPGDTVRFHAGCDKRGETCRVKFSNFSSYRGFPHIPGEDWLMAFPASSGNVGGGSMNR